MAATLRPIAELNVVAAVYVLEETLNEDKPTFVYIGRKWCGCVVAAMVAHTDPKGRKRTADFVWEMITEGLIIEHVELGSYQLVWDCPHPIEKPVVSPQLELFPTVTPE